MRNSKEARDRASRAAFAYFMMVVASAIMLALMVGI